MVYNSYNYSFSYSGGIRNDILKTNKNTEGIIVKWTNTVTPQSSQQREDRSLKIEIPKLRNFESPGVYATLEFWSSESINTNSMWLSYNYCEAAILNQNNQIVMRYKNMPVDKKATKSVINFYLYEGYSIHFYTMSYHNPYAYAVPKLTFTYNDVPPRSQAAPVAERFSIIADNQAVSKLPNGKITTILNGLVYKYNNAGNAINHSNTRSLKHGNYYYYYPAVQFDFLQSPSTIIKVPYIPLPVAKAPDVNKFSVIENSALIDKFTNGKILTDLTGLRYNYMNIKNKEYIKTDNYKHGNYDFYYQESDSFLQSPLTRITVPYIPYSKVIYNNIKIIIKKYLR